VCLARDAPARIIPRAGSREPRVRSLAATHRVSACSCAPVQLEISPDVWNAFTGHLNETVARFRIADRERNELVAIVQSLRPEIVNRP